MALNISVSIIMTAAIHRELFTQLKSLYPAASLKMNNYFSCKNEAGTCKNTQTAHFLNLENGLHLQQCIKAAVCSVLNFQVQILSSVNPLERAGMMGHTAIWENLVLGTRFILLFNKMSRRQLLQQWMWAECKSGATSNVAAVCGIRQSEFVTRQIAHLGQSNSK